MLLVPAHDRPPLTDPDDFYDTDLVGLQASTVDGRALGPVTDVLARAGVGTTSRYASLAASDSSRSWRPSFLK